MSRRLSLALLLAGLAAPIARGEAPPARVDIPGEVANTARRLDAADKLTAAKKWPEAVEEYQRILTEIGDDLVPLSPGVAPQAVQARWLVHRRLAALPPEALRLYRSRVDAQARRWFEQGSAARDVRLLRRVVEDAFCSRSGDRALELLGDLAFERGRFDEADYWWRLLSPPAAAPAPELVFPDPQVDVARVRAKQIMTLLFRGSNLVPKDRVEAELKAFRAAHPRAEGQLAGRSGIYADILQNLVADAAGLAPAEADDWPTFAGDPSRNAVPAAPAKRLARLLAGPPRWRFNLKTRARIAPEESPEWPAPGQVLPRTQDAQALAFQPVLVDGQVLVADARFVTAYDIRTGQAATWYDLVRGQDGQDAVLDLKKPVPAGLRHTLTVAEGCVFARLGSSCLGAARAPLGGRSFLVCLGLRTDDKGSRLRWQVSSDSAAPGSVFEGAPVVREGRAYIAATRLDRAQSVTSVVCYPVQAGGDAPQPRWRQDICSAAEGQAIAARSRHHLLTLAGPLVVYCSHTGAIVALDADTGRRAWAVRYLARSTPADETVPRGLAPCLCADGRLYAAPADSDRLFCLEAATGRTLWARDRIDAVDLLGAAGGRLLFTTTKELRAVDAVSGRDLWRLPHVDGLPPFGRGLLVDDFVLWPVAPAHAQARGMYVLAQADGEQAGDFLSTELLNRHRWGNLTYADGCLAVADVGELRLYVGPGHFRGEAERRVEASPDSAEARYRLALAEIDDGLAERALADLEAAERLVGETGPPQEQIRAARHELLLDQAGRLGQAKRWDEAAAKLAQAAGADFPIPQRLRALQRQAALWAEAGQPAQAISAWQRILSDKALRLGRTNDLDSRGGPQRGGALAAAGIAELTRAHGSGVYAAVEQEARQRRAAIGQGERLKALEQLAQEFPNAAAAAEARQELIRSYEHAGQLGAAADICRAALRHAGQMEAAGLLSQLARLYEREHCWEAARAEWQELARRGDAGADGELQKPEYRASADDIVLPLLRAWELELAPGERLLTPEVADGDVVLFGARNDKSEGGRLTCRERTTGNLRWGYALPFVPAWAGCLADLVLAAGPGGVAALRLADGRLAWDFPASAEQLSGFRLVSGRLFFLQAANRLFALDAQTGFVLWVRRAPGWFLDPPALAGHFLPPVYADSSRILLRLSGGSSWTLDAETGGMVYEAGTDPRPWPQPPLALARGHVCVVRDSRQLAVLDLASGREVWTFAPRDLASLNGDPLQLCAAAQALYVFIPRNYAWTWQALEPQGGKPIWPTERVLTTAAFDAGRLALGPDAVYHEEDGTLRALARGEGKERWRVKLPSSGRWQLLYRGGQLIAWPLDGTSPVLPVCLFDPKDGLLVQRLNLACSPKQGPPTVYFTRGGLTVAPGDRVAHWKDGIR